MFITRKHISRRTFLRGAGVAVGLPFLDAMVPAGTALAAKARSWEVGPDQSPNRFVDPPNRCTSPT